MSLLIQRSAPCAHSPGHSGGSQSGSPYRAPKYISWLQQELNRLNNAGLSVDGKYGPRTSQALTDFQRGCGLTPDGAPGPKTQAELLQAGANPPPATTPETPAPQQSLSPLASAPRGLRTTGKIRRIPLHGICVHMTGSGPAEKAAKNPGKSALDFALDYYLDGRGGYPHYVVGYDGAIIAACDERRIAGHASWRTPGGRTGWEGWQAPDIWSRFWNPRGIHSPVDFLPQNAGYANQVYLGIELLATQRLGEYTDQQYRNLARLIRDIADRYGLKLTKIPGPHLLGHEDINPITRFGSDGQGYDPGALRRTPLFSWDRLASQLENPA